MSYLRCNDPCVTSPPQAEYVSYCNKLTAHDPVMWGGHPEIVALAAVLKRQIVVHSADGLPLTVGDAAVTKLPPLHISYVHYTWPVPRELLAQRRDDY